MRGEALGNTCLSCHGTEAYDNADLPFRAPRLGGQKASYLVIALNAYRNGTRQEPTMVALAGGLTDQEIADVVAYLVRPGAQTAATSGSPGAGPRAARPCGACHGQKGIGLSPGWPTLAGQHEDYLVQAIKQYRDGARKDPVMVPIVSLLSDETVALLAKYYASLEGLRTTAVK